MKAGPQIPFPELVVVGVGLELVVVVVGEVVMDELLVVDLVVVVTVCVVVALVGTTDLAARKLPRPLIGSGMVTVIFLLVRKKFQVSTV